MSRTGFSKPSAELSFVACAIVESTFAVPIARVREIIQPMQLTRVPEAPPALLGAVDHRGEVVPVIDVGYQMSGKPTLDVRRKWILIKSGERTVGVVVRQVFEVFRTREAEMRRAPEMGGAFGYTTREVVTYEGTMAFVLDLDAVARLAATGQGPVGEVVLPEGLLLHPSTAGHPQRNVPQPKGNAGVGAAAHTPVPRPAGTIAIPPAPPDTRSGGSS